MSVIRFVYYIEYAILLCYHVQHLTNNQHNDAMYMHIDFNGATTSNANGQ
jgi:hypothetical protein